MKFIYILIFLLLVSLPPIVMHASGPQLHHTFDIHAICGNAMDVGDVPGGKRVVIPIVGGNVSGDITAEILPGGADYQMIDTIQGRTSYEAIYSLRTHDGVIINVKNTGISTDGRLGEYFTTVPSFEAPLNSAYGWLNNRIFICRAIKFERDAVHLRVWIVK